MFHERNLSCVSNSASNIQPPAAPRIVLAEKALHRIHPLSKMGGVTTIDIPRFRLNPRLSVVSSPACKSRSGWIFSRTINGKVGDEGSERCRIED